ncbi:MAG TPA: hypothetical protein DDZ80_05385 [Cyanobacteria bacterium UBA8803]|nr:hypothetical protein [Cyanobacteria bacterium UBA9273]HBL57977.1 hypothetical protein [Cyanobacteria bacterium UBA8803]
MFKKYLILQGDRFMASEPLQLVLGGVSKRFTCLLFKIDRDKVLFGFKIHYIDQVTVVYLRNAHNWDERLVED